MAPAALPPSRSSSRRLRCATSSVKARPTRSIPRSRPAASTACRRWTPLWPSLFAPVAPRSSRSAAPRGPVRARPAHGRRSGPPGRRRKRLPAMSSISYVFRAVDGLGVKHKGEIDGESADGVGAELLKGRGLIALEVKAKTQSMELVSSTSSRGDVFRGPGAVDAPAGDHDLVRPVADARACRTGVPDAEQAPPGHGRKPASGHRERRLSLGRALAKHPKIFLRVVCRDDSRRRDRWISPSRAPSSALPTSFEAQHKGLCRQVKSAMVYPAVVTSIAICVCVAMLIFIIPVFAGVFLKQFVTRCCR